MSNDKTIGSPDRADNSIVMTPDDIRMIRACLSDGSYTPLEQKDFGALCEMALRLIEITAAAKADADDLAKMRDGTKLTRAGLVEVIAYQQQDKADLLELLRQARHDLKIHDGEYHHVTPDWLTKKIDGELERGGFHAPQ